MSGEEWRVLYTAKPVAKLYRVRCLNEACWRNQVQQGDFGVMFAEEAKARAVADVHATDNGHEVVVEGPAAPRGEST